MNINVKNKTKLVEKVRGYTHKITCTPAENYPRL